MDLQQHIKRARIFRWPLFIAICMIPFLGGCGGGQLTLGGIVEQLILGLILGSVYALIALGYTLVYGVIKLINFAHGDIYMLGAFVGFYMLRFTIRWLNFTYGISLVWCWVISVIVSIVLCAILAVVMERFAYRPLRGSSRIAALITAVGVSFFLENAGIIVFGPNPKSYEPKTLEVYQLQVAASDNFDGAKQYELMDTSQKLFDASRFRQPAYLRVRLVSKKGFSAWSPTLEVTSAQKRGYVEDEGQAAAEIVEPIHSLGYSRKTERGREVLAVNWDSGRVEDVKMHPVFSDSSGAPLAVLLPFKTAQGDKVRVPVFNIVIVIVTLLLLWGLNYLINHSAFGISMRALSYDGNAAKLMGINTDKVIAQTFAVGGACAAVAGNMVGIYNQAIEPLMGILPGIKAFVAAVVGGIGSIPGAAAGGMIMGVTEALVKGNIDPGWSPLADAVAFAILIVVLLFKPSGIFGTATREKV